MVKLLGARVQHRYKHKGDGSFHPNGSIYVSREGRNTRYGCFVLAHELGHCLDFLNGKFPKWFRGEFVKKNKWIPPSYVRRLEGSANNFAKTVFKKYGLSTRGIYELNDVCFEQFLLPYWTLKYNGFGVNEIKQIIENIYEEAKIPYYWSARNRRRSGRSGRKNSRSSKG
jgi:hypothetical protein